MPSPERLGYLPTRFLATFPAGCRKESCLILWGQSGSGNGVPRDIAGHPGPMAFVPLSCYCSLPQHPVSLGPYVVVSTRPSLTCSICREVNRSEEHTSEL